MIVRLYAAAPGSAPRQSTHRKIVQKDVGVIAGAWENHGVGKSGWPRRF